MRKFISNHARSIIRKKHNLIKFIDIYEFFHHQTITYLMLNQFIKILLQECGVYKIDRLLVFYTF